ncbi:MAG: glycosyltransferase [Acutalibacteraceae bacterium]|nr:glycosyltransferase [Acutalibacteraceae bacterium]
MNKEIVFLIISMRGGGAERVISLLSRAAAEKGNSVSLILTHQSKNDAVLRDIDNRINVISLPDETENQKVSSLSSKLLMLFARIIGKLGFKEKSSVLKYRSRNYKSIVWLKKYFRKHSDASVVAFLYDSIFYSLLSVTKKNKLIISERGDPCQSLSSKTTVAFLKNEFHKADGVVFQSPDVQKWYKDNTPVKGTVIFNPVKPDLPEVYEGEKIKRIVNFCRISGQKNLIMLVDAFAEFREEFPEYELDIIGDPVGNEVEGYLDSVNERIRYHHLENSIHIFPARSDIHDYIKDYAMFVSSSDYEGMSNSMLEAMAMGIPCVCTDCPAGGARAVIKDGENGLLTPVGDAHALSEAMKKIASDPSLADKLSKNSVKIREEQSVEKIIKEWMDLING